MERQHTYKATAQARPGNLREGGVIDPPRIGGQGAGILRAALALGGEFMNVRARDYAREMRGRMDDAVLSVNAEFEKWKTEYKATTQGAYACNARQDYAAKYQELADKAMLQFDGTANEVYAADLKREFARNSLYAIKEGGAYQLQQEEVWQKSQWQSQLSAFKKAVDDNPDDPEMLDMERRALLESWIAKNPGQDPRAIRHMLDSMLANGRLQSFLARAQGGDETALGAAKAMLAGAGGFSKDENSLRRGKTANTSGMDGEVVRLIREIAPKYNVDPELALAVSKAESGGKANAAVSRAGAVGPMQLIPKWAGKAGFDPYDLRQNIEGGISELASLLKKYGNEKEALIAYNWGQGNWDAYKKTGKGHYGQDRPPESLGYVNAVFRHTGGETVAGAGETGASLPGLTSVEARKYLNQIEGLEKRENAQAKASLEQALADYQAAALDGKADTVPIDPGQVARLYGDRAGEVLETINDYGRLSDFVQRLKFTPESEMGRVLKDTEPEGEGYARKSRLRGQYRKAIQSHMAEREKNPTGYLMATNPQLQEAYNRMLREWTPESVKAYLLGLAAAREVIKLQYAPIFPQGQAQAVAGMIMESPDCGQMLEGMQKAFGQSWGRAFQELSQKDCLPVAAQVVGNGLPAADARLLMQAARDKDFEKDFYSLHKDFLKADFEAKTLERTQEFMDTLVGGGDQAFAAELVRSVGLLAMQYVNTQGLDYVAAIEKAANTAILDKYSILSVNGRKFRAPKELDGDRIERGCAAMLGEAAANYRDFLFVGLPHIGEREQELYKNYILKNGYWTTSEDESGAYLFVGGRAVRDKSGKPVMKTWQELLAAKEAGRGALDQPWQEDAWHFSQK